MRLLVPVKSLEEVKILIEKGADALYCGYIEDNKSYSAWDYEEANFEDWSEFKKAIKLSNNKKIPIYCNLDIHKIHNQDELENILERTQKINKLGISGFIVANISLLFSLKKLGFKIILSRHTGVVNPSAVRFFNNYGFCNIMLTEHLYASEIKILKDSSKNTRFYLPMWGIECPTNNIYCLLEQALHWEGFTTGCNVPAKKTIVSRVKKEISTKKDIFKNIDFDSKFRNRCYLCRLYELKNIDYLVIIGTYFNTKQKIEAVQNLKFLIKKLNTVTKNDFTLLCHNIIKKKGIDCKSQRCRHYEEQ